MCGCDWVCVKALAGPIKECDAGCAERVIILLEGEPSAQSGVTSLQVFYYLQLCSFPSTLSRPHITASESERALV